MPQEHLKGQLYPSNDYDMFGLCSRFFALKMASREPMVSGKILGPKINWKGANSCLLTHRASVHVCTQYLLRVLLERTRLHPLKQNK